MKSSRSFGVKQALPALGLAFLLSGCATSGNPKDPFEPFNRAMFTFNDKLDQVALRPAATAYRNTLPSFIQTGIGNFFGNLGDVWTAANNLLQGKGADGLSDIMRVAINSTLGVGGLIDFGSEMGMVKHREDFGQTLGVWGVKPGPYVVLPVYGSFTLRDTAAFPLDFFADPWVYATPVRVRNTGTVVRLVDKRAAVLDASDLLEEAALDKYVFVRDAYLQRREGQVGREDKPYSSFNDDDESYPDAAVKAKTADVQSLPAAPEAGTGTPGAAISPVQSRTSSQDSKAEKLAGPIDSTEQSPIKEAKSSESEAK